jgi:hypothetical protein
MSETTLNSDGLKKIYDDLKRSHDDIRKKIDAEMEKSPTARLDLDILIKMNSDAGEIMVGANSAYNMYLTKAVIDIHRSVKKVNAGIEAAANTISNLQEAARIIGIISSLVAIAAVIVSAAQDLDNLGKLPSLVEDLNKQIETAKAP